MENNELNKEKLEEEKAKKEIQMVKDEETRRFKETFRETKGYEFVMEIIDSEIEKLDSLSAFKISKKDTENSVIAILAQQQAIQTLNKIRARIR